DYVPGALALLGRAQVQQALGQHAAAIDSYQRLLEQDAVDPLRPARMQATVGLIELRLAADPPQIDEAIAQAKPVIDTARPNEKSAPEYAALQVALAKAYFAAADRAQSGGKAADARRSTTEARPLLTAAIKVPGNHEADARELLAKLGIEKPENAGKAADVQPKSLEE